MKTKLTPKTWISQNLGAKQPQLKEERKFWGDGKGLGKSQEVEGRIQKSLKAGRKIGMDEVTVAGKRKKSLAQEQHWLKALQEEITINLWARGGRKGRAGEEKWLYMKIGIFVIGQFITIVLVALSIK